MTGDFNFKLDQLGIAGVGLVLIVVGIILSNTKDLSSHWGHFCIAFGVCAIAFDGAKGSKGNLQLAAIIVCGISFLVALGILLTAL